LHDMNPSYKGVAGWLLLLCVSLTILDPFAILFNLVFVTSALKPHFDQHPDLLRLMLIGGVCRIGLMVYSIYAGISLWRSVPTAPETAAKYFVVVAIYAVVSVFLPALAGVPEDIYRTMAASALANGLITVVYAALWYLYLKKSKRVKATYTPPVTS
jgi:hypothetical protein